MGRDIRVTVTLLSLETLANGRGLVACCARPTVLPLMGWPFRCPAVSCGPGPRDDPQLAQERHVVADAPVLRHATVVEPEEVDVLVGDRPTCRRDAHQVSRVARVVRQPADDDVILGDQVVNLPALIRADGGPPAKGLLQTLAPRRLQVALYAATQPGIHRRAGPLLRALADARATDAELLTLWTSIEARRHDGQSRFVLMLAARGALREGLSVEEAADGLWALTSLAVYDLLVTTRGWPEQRYLAWLEARLVDQLLSPVL